MDKKNLLTYEGLQKLESELLLNPWSTASFPKCQLSLLLQYTLKHSADMVCNAIRFPLRVLRRNLPLSDMLIPAKATHDRDSPHLDFLSADRNR